MIKNILKNTLFSWMIVNIFYSQLLAQQQPKPRIIVSTDIGGTDPDDNQSMIHLMMYSDLFQIEGLISSPFGKGRKKDLLDMIDLYEKDFLKLKKHNSKLATPYVLRAVCKQGETESAPTTELLEICCLLI